ncbi:pyridoxamine 5'-phosphate oxidase family protein [Veillonella sp. R32]|uniref:pyridoxamine 5'-phosphate oxidase family protein n=1 Tax=Veillonella sp. R32 TaxID=2021312 RepID=UPI00138A1B51|nr:pyridoxamine 5'-phosphate oxidase family protein [Veillonella sp. R32]KAF1679115.1 FMN-binding protein [Veillonella sp. R32]
MLPEKFFEVLNYEGVVSITTWSDNEAHVTNTWNSYLKIKDDTLLIPAAGMTSTEADIKKNNRVIITLGAREVEGFNGYQGTGFRLEGTADFIANGPIYDEMFAEFPFLKRVLAVKIESAKQLL